MEERSHLSFIFQKQVQLHGTKKLAEAQVKDALSCHVYSCFSSRKQLPPVAVALVT